jgi:hypothetical protein
VEGEVVNEDVWIKVDDHSTNEGTAGEQYVKASAIIHVGTYMQARNAPPVPGSTVTTGRVFEPRGTLLTLVDGTRKTVTGLTPREVIALAQGRDDEVHPAIEPSVAV